MTKTYNPQKHHRRSIRLKRYDYTQPGAYFVTICTQGRTCLFGDVVDGEMVSNPFGRVAATYQERIPRHFPHVQLGAWVVMPNHVHGIIIITDDVDVGGRGEAFPATLFNTIHAGNALLPGQQNTDGEECLAFSDDTWVPGRGEAFRPSFELRHTNLPNTHSSEH